MCVCVLPSHFFWTSDLWTHQPRSHRISHLPSFCGAVLASIFIARRIQPSLSLVDREVEFLYRRINRSPLVWHVFFCEEIPVRVTAPRFKLTSLRQKVSRLPTEPPGRPNVNTARGSQNMYEYEGDEMSMSLVVHKRGTKVTNSGSHHGDNPLIKPTGIQIATKPLPGSTNREHRKLIGVKMSLVRTTVSTVWSAASISESELLIPSTEKDLLMSCPSEQNNQK